MSDPNTHARTHFHGRLNLEQQKRRAKDLLKLHQQGDAQALRRMAAYLSGAVTPKLSDAQFVIARENGFASWPKLKAHCDRLRAQAQLIEQGRPTVFDTRETLHIRCGSDIQHTLKVAGFQGAFLEFADPFCQGPVPDLPRPQFIERRAAFIAAAYGIAPKDALARGQKEYAALAAVHEHSHAVLWFEHDTYDQLILAFVLAQFLDGPRPQRLELICVDAVPGVPDFVGLGQLAPEPLQWLWETARRPVTREQMETGKRVWDALRKPDPHDLLAIARAGTPALPLMAPALLRHLSELPSPHTGLGLTQSLMLEIIADTGPVTAGKVFKILMSEREPLPYLGDAMFWSALTEMRQTLDPVFRIENPDKPWPLRVLTITPAGADVLNGRTDYLGIYTGERWVGGVRIRPAHAGGAGFRFDPQQIELVHG